MTKGVAVPAVSEPLYSDISPAGQASLLDIAFARIRYGFSAMVVVSLPFIAWYMHLGRSPFGLVMWAAAYLAATAVLTVLARRYRHERATENPETVLHRWLPRIRVLALLYGSSLTIPPLLTAHNASFEFQLLYLVTVAAIVAGNAVHSSPVLSVFRYFFITGWGGVTLLVPYVFPEHWYYVLPLTLVYVGTMLKHSALSHRFFVHNIVLQEKGARLAEDSRIAKEVAEKALHDKTRFLTTASHDLRQPVHAMGFLIESIAFRNRDATLNPALDDLRRSVRSLNLMFNSLLDLSKIESGAVEVEPAPVALDPLMREVATLFGEEARSRGLDVRVRPTRGAMVLADPLLLRQSLVNLAHNALRYTAHGGVLLCARRRGAEWRLEVWDTGMGVASADKGKIFSPFYRNEYAWRIDSAGHGVGLAVVARCADLMGASHGFESIEGRGSWFWIRVPAVEQREVASAILPATAKATQGPLSGRCLVVDDDPQASVAWASLMQAWGVDARCVASGREAIAVLDTGFRPQAILCDQRLRAGESGFDVLRALLARIPEAAGAMVSGEYDSPELVQAEVEGYFVLYKPLDASDLHAILSLWLDSRRTQAA
jgi:signal transduction histidine kinase/CheY-like chemotaxis protein